MTIFISCDSGKNSYFRLNIIWYDAIVKVLLKAKGLKCPTERFRLYFKRLGSKSKMPRKAEK